MRIRTRLLRGQLGLPYLATQGRRGLGQPLPEGYGQFPRDVDIENGFPGHVDSMHQDVHVMNGALGKGIRRENLGIQVHRQAAVQQQTGLGTGDPQYGSAVPELGIDGVATQRRNLQPSQYFIVRRPSNPEALRPDPEDRSIADRYRTPETGRDPAIQDLRQPVADRFEVSLPAGNRDEISLDTLSYPYAGRATLDADPAGPVNSSQR